MEELTMEETKLVAGGDMDCYLGAFGATVATAGAIAAPNPITIGTAIWRWGSAYELCIQ